MIEVITKESPLYKRKEIWFYNHETVAELDNDLFYKSYVKPDFKTIHLKENDTLFIDLKRSEEELFNDIQSKMRAKIRRAEKENLFFEVWEDPDHAQLEKYVRSYNRFAATKSIEGSLESERLYAYSEKKILIITGMKHENKPITYHSYLKDGNKIVVSLYIHHDLDFENDTFRGFANKLHFWKDILYFKTLGISRFDFGGVDFVDTPEGIAQFKMAFGGVLTKQYNFQRVKGLYGMIQKLK